MHTYWYCVYTFLVDFGVLSLLWPERGSLLLSLEILPLKDQTVQEMPGSAANQEHTYVLLTNFAVNLRS